MTIHSFETFITALPTKTKPKRISLIGSDGLKYSFLLKGLEDLRLDERVMQFISSTDRMLAQDGASRERNLRARHYNVIPLGDRFGMIEWISNMTQLFSFYKRWQVHSHELQEKKDDDDTAVILRPHELYHKKITAALKSSKISKSAPRKSWPVKLLKEVFMELVSETPSTLISNELWCSSSSVSAYKQKTDTFSKSLAVMSMIGYVMGLGDRRKSF